jgi:hypothetical protein
MISRSVHFFLEGAAFDHRGLDARVEDGHEAQRLHHVRAVVAGQAHVDLEVEVAVQRLDLVDHFLLDLGRVAARPQQRQHQGGEFMAQRQAGKAQLLLLPTRCSVNEGLRASLPSVRRVILSLRRDWMVCSSSRIRGRCRCRPGMPPARTAAARAPGRQRVGS